MPFARAAELLSKATGVSFSEHTLHDVLADFTEALFWKKWPRQRRRLPNASPRSGENPYGGRCWWWPPTAPAGRYSITITAWNMFMAWRRCSSPMLHQGASMDGCHHGPAVLRRGDQGDRRAQAHAAENGCGAGRVRKLIGYLENNSHRIDYAHNRRGGYALGSVGIESANKFTCHVRLKRSGAWWVKENGNGMLALRCALVNGTLDDAFRNYVAKDQHKCYTNGTNA